MLSFIAARWRGVTAVVWGFSGRVGGCFGRGLASSRRMSSGTVFTAAEHLQPDPHEHDQPDDPDEDLPARAALGRLWLAAGVDVDVG